MNEQQLRAAIQERLNQSIHAGTRRSAILNTKKCIRCETFFVPERTEDTCKNCKPHAPIV